MSTLRAFARPVPPMTPAMVGDAAFERFVAEPDLPLLPVVDADGAPLGLIARDSCLTRLAGHFGRSVYAHRPLTLLMEAAPLIVDAAMLAGDFAAHVLREPEGRAASGFIVVSRGRYLGVGSLIDLLAATVAERSQALAALNRLAAALATSNRELERHRGLVDTVIAQIPMLVAVRARGDGRIRLINRTGAAMLGTTQAALADRTPGQIVPAGLGHQLRRAARMLDRLPDGTPCDLSFLPAHGVAKRTLLVTQIGIDGAADVAGDESLALVVAEDVTEARAASRRISGLALTDTLTGLANRVRWQERLAALLAPRESGERENGAPAAERVALLLIDLDRFKPINDTHGHVAGDAVLRATARRLEALIRPGDLAARLGGDEFAVVIAGPDAEAVAEHTAAQLVAGLRAPISIGGKSVHVGASVGVAVAPDDAADRDELIKHADFALYRAKAAGRGQWQRFSEEMRAGLDLRDRLAGDLAHALDRGEICFHVQPKFELQTHRVTGFECLMRWRHPLHGDVPPDTFIPIAEHTGLIVMLGEWAIRSACALAATLPEHISVAVNVSGAQVARPGLVACVAQAIAQAGIAAGRLELEITESVLMAEDEGVLNTIGRLRELGVRTALDDFGTGYASFAYLRRFPFDRVKLDRSFVAALPDERSARAIIAAMIVLAVQLGAEVTAEGVETTAQADVLRELGCNDVQGFLFGAPGPDPFAWLPGVALRAVG